jgi:hypothetical protein
MENQQNRKWTSTTKTVLKMLNSSVQREMQAVPIAKLAVLKRCSLVAL